MRYSKLFVNLVLFFTVPLSIAYPKAEIPVIPIHSQTVSSETDVIQRHGYNNPFFSYDDILDLLEELEEGDLEKRCSPEELERINYFIALLAKQGILPNEVDEEFILENDIQELLYSDPNSSDFTYSLYQGGDYEIAPVIFFGPGEVILCKSWIKKKWEQTKKFVKKHKKAIIIGAAVVVAATVVICVVAASAAGAAAAASAGALSQQDHEEKKQTASKNEEPISFTPESENQPEASVFTDIQDTDCLKAALDEHISSFKEELAQVAAKRTMGS